jgi:hypothetical protein
LSGFSRTGGVVSMGNNPSGGVALVRGASRVIVPPMATSDGPNENGLPVSDDFGAIEHSMIIIPPHPQNGDDEASESLHNDGGVVISDDVEAYEA